MMAWAGILFLFLLSFILWVPSQWILPWLLSLISTEYGHYFALFIVLLLVFFVRDWQKVVCLLAAIIFFLAPLNQLHRLRPDLTLNYLKLWQLYSKSATPETLVYSRPDGVELKLDFYRPPPPILDLVTLEPVTKKLPPWILIIHGGAWKRGSEKEISSYSTTLAKEGYGVISIAYRLLPQFKWPAPQIDAFTAIDFVKAHASEWGIDANRWVVLGRSAGAHIAESIAYAKVDPSLKGCISFYGPSDLIFSYENGAENDILHSPRLLRDLLGGTPAQAKENFASASPLHFVSAQSPPTLLLHGELDPIISIKQSERLDEKLKSFGVYSHFVRIPWGTHGFDFNPHGPSGQLSAAEVDAFLKKIFP
jgi:acetyl esterase/lipase